MLLGYKESDEWEEIAPQVRNPFWKFGQCVDADGAAVGICFGRLVYISFQEKRKKTRLCKKRFRVFL
jgi:hypothetical protein